MFFLPKSQKIQNPIRKYRRQLGLSQVELGKLVGKPRQQTVHDWEFSNFLPEKETQAKLAEIFGIPYSRFAREIKIYSLLCELEELVLEEMREKGTNNTFFSV